MYVAESKSRTRTGLLPEEEAMARMFRPGRSRSEGTEAKRLTPQSFSVWSPTQVVMENIRQQAQHALHTAYANLPNNLHELYPLPPPRKRTQQEIPDFPKEDSYRLDSPHVYVTDLG